MLIKEIHSDQAAPQKDPWLANFARRIGKIADRVENLNSSADDLLSRIFGNELKEVGLASSQSPSMGMIAALAGAIDRLEAAIGVAEDHHERLHNLA